MRSSSGERSRRTRPLASSRFIHDFVMLNALRDTHAAQAALSQAVGFLRDALNVA